MSVDRMNRLAVTLSALAIVITILDPSPVLNGADLLILILTGTSVALVIRAGRQSRREGKR